MNKKVKVGGIYYGVEMVEDLQGKDGCWGETEYKHPTIKLDDRLNKERLHQTFIHELVHAIFFESGAEQDEHSIDIVSKVLYQVLVDNDLSFITGQETETLVYYES